MFDKWKIKINQKKYPSGTRWLSYTPGHWDPSGTGFYKDSFTLFSIKRVKLCLINGKLR
jgi:hypothetical protein